MGLRIIGILLVALLLAPPAVLAVECFSPLVWQPKLENSPLDLNHNYVDDRIDAMPPGLPVDLILALNDCPRSADLERFDSYGTVVYVGRYLSFVAIDGVPAVDAIELASDPLVGFVDLSDFFEPALDISNPAIKVRASPDYSPNTIEDQHGLTGAGVTIAIVDTGVDDQAGPGTGHESLPANKYVGGYDASLDQYINPDDTLGHGTHVASIALGTGGASQIYEGIAPDANLVDVKAVPGKESDVLRALERGVLDKKDDWDIRVVNMSFGNCLDTNGTGPMAQMVNRLVFHGLVSVVAAGNTPNCGLPPGSQRVPSPAGADDAITVGNLRTNGTIDRTNDDTNPTSLRGPRLSDGDLDIADEQKPDLMAPGTNITAAVANTISSYGDRSGTSMAAPHVAGCAALMIEGRAELRPLAVKQALIESAEDRGAAGWDSENGHGYLDCFAAVERVLDSSCATDLGFEVYIGKPGSNPDWWDSPDLYPVNPMVIEAVPNTIKVRITNFGPNAISDFLVRVGIYNFGNGDSDYTICSVPVSLPIPLGVGAKATVDCPYTPAVSGLPPGTVHACLKAEAVSACDRNSVNNRAQHNVNIRQTHSPAELRMQVVNPTHDDLTVRLETELDEETTGWQVSTSLKEFFLSADACPKPVDISLEPVDPDATPAGEVSVRVVGIDQEGNEEVLGGVVMIGWSPAMFVVFSDGFESGDTTAWSGTTP